MPDLHPDYLNAAPRKRWVGPLSALRGALDTEADRIWRSQVRRGEWAYRVLAHGACVAARKANGRRYVRISRSTPPRDRQKWERELETFAKQLLLEGWERESDPNTSGVAVIFSCPIRLLCECGAKLDPNAQLFGGDRCSACQIRHVRRKGVA